MATKSGGPNQVWYTGAPPVWTALTGRNTNVDSISVGANNQQYMVGSDNGGPVWEWIYAELRISGPS